MATIFQSLRRWFGNVGTTGQQQGVQYGQPFTIINGEEGKPVPDYGIDGSLQVSSVWGAVELLVSNIASLPIQLIKKPLLPSDVPMVDASHSIALILASPNRHMTWMEFMSTMLLSFFFRGNAYARLYRDEKTGAIIEMWPMSADQVEIELLKSGDLVYKYSFEGKIFVYSPDSVLHFKDTGNGLIGLARLDFMRNTLATSVAEQEHTRRTFQKAGRQPGVFMIDRLLTKPQRDSIRENYKDLVEGTSSDLPVLEAGAKFQPLGMTPADVQLLESRKFTVEEIARWFGVPSVLINDTSATTNWGTGIEQIIEGFYKFRLRPLLVLFQQSMNKRILSAGDRALYEFKFDPEALFLGTLKDRLEYGAKGVQNGLLLRNEWRRNEGLAPVAGGNVPTAQTNLAPLEMLGKIKAQPQGNGDGTSQDSLRQ